MQHPQSQHGNIDAAVETAKQRRGSVTSNCEASPTQHVQLVATSHTQTWWDTDNCSRSSAPVDQQQQPKDIGAAGGSDVRFHSRQPQSPAQHFETLLQPPPATAACFSPIAAPPAALPPAPMKVCRAQQPPKALAVSRGLAKQDHFSNSGVARVLELSPTTDEQQVHISDWLTSQGV